MPDNHILIEKILRQFFCSESVFVFMKYNILNFILGSNTDAWESAAGDEEKASKVSQSQ